MIRHETDVVSRQGVTHLGLPSPKVWVSILVVPHQCTLLHIKVATIGGLSIHLHHPIVRQAQVRCVNMLQPIGIRLDIAAVRCC